MVLGCFSDRVTENEGVNKMSLHNLATVFGPTLLRPSEKDSKILNSPQPISMNDSWSLEVMAQVRHLRNAAVDQRLISVPRLSAGAGPPLLSPAGGHPSARQQASKPSLLHRSMTANRAVEDAQRWSLDAALEGPFGGTPLDRRV